MEKLIKNIVLQHPNKRINIVDIDDALKKHRINLFQDSQNFKQFTTIIQKYIDQGVLVPLKTSKSLQHYGRLQNKFTINKALLKKEKSGPSSKYLNELMTLSPSINIDYYATHPDQYSQDREYIQKINELIRKKDEIEEITVNERSYLLFGDEKAILLPKDASINGEEILRNLKLSLEDIKAKKVFEPFFWIEKDFNKTKESRVVLIVENKDTFWTLQNAVISGDINGVQLVIYGEGNAIIRKFEYIETIGGTPEDHYYYFGDIDQEGIFIFNRLRERYLPYNIKPAVPLYRFILQKAGPYNAKPLRKSRKARFTLSPFIDFFDSESKAQISKIILEQKYLPQEILNKTDFRRLKLNGLL